MEYKNYSKKACVVRLFKWNQKLPFQVTHFDSVKGAYTYLSNIGIQFYLEPAQYQMSRKVSLTTFRNRVNKGYGKGRIVSSYLMSDYENEIYKFTVVLQ